MQEHGHLFPQAEWYARAIHPPDDFQLAHGPPWMHMAQVNQSAYALPPQAVQMASGLSTTLLSDPLPAAAARPLPLRPPVVGVKRDREEDAERSTLPKKVAPGHPYVPNMEVPNAAIEALAEAAKIAKRDEEAGCDSESEDETFFRTSFLKDSGPAHALEAAPPNLRHFSGPNQPSSMSIGNDGMSQYIKSAMMDQQRESRLQEKALRPQQQETLTIPALAPAPSILNYMPTTNPAPAAYSMGMHPYGGGLIPNLIHDPAILVNSMAMQLFSQYVREHQRILTNSHINSVGPMTGIPRPQPVPFPPQSMAIPMSSRPGPMMTGNAFMQPIPR